MISISNLIRTRTKFSLIILISAIGFVFLNSNPVFAVEFSNYTSEKFKISFQYPSDWTIKEPTSRFDDQKITIDAPSPFIHGQINIALFEDITDISGTDNIQDAAEDLMEGLTEGYTRDSKIIEKVSALKINEQDTRTFITSSKDAFDSSSKSIGSQIWLVFTEHELGYLIAFMQSASNFDSPKSTEIRDKFINSIRFIS